MPLEEVGVKLVAEGEAQFLGAMKKAHDATRGFGAAAKDSHGPTQGLTERASALTYALGQALYAAAVAAGRAIIGFGRDSIEAASNLQETTNKIAVVFGDAADDVNASIGEIGTSLGQSTQQMLDAASTFGVFGKSAGLTGAPLADFSMDLTTLASDLASFYNTSPEEAIVAIGAALRGESEPIRKYGVLLDDATLRQKALELGIIRTTKNSLTPQQRVLAANAVIMDQTKDAQGDFIRTSDGLANSQRIVTAEVENLKAKFGTALLPVMQSFTSLLATKLLPAASKFVDEFILPAIPKIQAIGDAIGYFFTKIETVVEYLKGGGTMKEGVFNYLFGANAGGIIFGIVEALQPLVTAFQNFFSAIQEDGPMIQASLQGIWDFLVGVFQTVGPQLIGGLTAIVDTLTSIWQKHGETIMAVLTFLWNTIVVVIAGALQLVVGIFQVAATVLEGVMDALSLALSGNWAACWEAIKLMLANAWQIIVTTLTNFMNLVLSLVGTNLEEFLAMWENNFRMLGDIVEFGIQSVIDFITTKVSEFIAAGRNIVEGIKQGFLDAWHGFLNSIIAKIESLPGWVKSILGIGSPSKVFMEIGADMMIGWEKGILENAMRPALATSLASQMSAAASTPRPSGPINYSYSTSNAYNLTVMSSQSPQVVERSYAMMKFLAG